MNKDLKYWLAMNKVPKVGPVTIKKLWEHFGSARAAWEAKDDHFSRIEGLSKSALTSFLENRSQIDLDDEFRAVQQKGMRVFTLEDEDYPELLRNIYDPPPVLYASGDILKEDKKAIAIVGTRKASAYGKEITRKLAFELASLGFTIVSGLADGIDTAAHRGALEAGGRTFAVFGCGVDVIFPSTNRYLSEQIKDSGALVSEFPMGTRPEKGSFPRRNRVISGLSLGTIVVEGHYDSGAMITAKYAVDQGREVFATPGNVDLDQSKGPHWLIKQGAKLVESAEDVMDELKLQIPNSKSQTNPKSQIQMTEADYSNLSGDEQKIVSVLSLEPKYIDNISIETELSIPQVLSLLLMLEVKKLVRQLPGKMFVLY